MHLKKSEQSAFSEQFAFSEQSAFSEQPAFSEETDFRTVCIDPLNPNKFYIFGNETLKTPETEEYKYIETTVNQEYFGNVKNCTVFKNDQNKYCFLIVGVSTDKGQLSHNIFDINESKLISKTQSKLISKTAPHYRLFMVTDVHNETIVHFVDEKGCFQYKFDSTHLSVNGNCKRFYFYFYFFL